MRRKQEKLAYIYIYIYIYTETFSVQSSGLSCSLGSTGRVWNLEVCNVGHLPTADDDDLRAVTLRGKASVTSSNSRCE